MSETSMAEKAVSENTVPENTVAERTAQQKFSCPSCGGESKWTPGKQALICPYCGTTSPAELKIAPDGTTSIVEHDLALALRSIPDSARGFQTERTQVRCQSCQAVSLFEPARVSQSCEFCGSSALIPHEETKEAFRPESLLPMKLGEPAVREAIRKWYDSHFFSPSNLGKKAMTDRVSGLYVPYWTFDAKVHATWTAESGTYYYVTESYRDSKGQSRTRRVQKTRWSPARGEIDHVFDDELVPATKGVELDLLREVEPFPTKEVVPYDPGFLSGWIVERYQLDLVAAAEHSRKQMNREVNRLCAADVPGDTHRNLQTSPNYSAQTFKHILVPVWVLTYQYRAKTYQVVINGVTGKIGGHYPLSYVKIFFAVLLALSLVALFAYLSTSK